LETSGVNRQKFDFWLDGMAIGQSNYSIAISPLTSLLHLSTVYIFISRTQSKCSIILYQTNETIL